MSSDEGADNEGRRRGRAAGLKRGFRRRMSMTMAAAVVGGLVLSLAITFSNSVGKGFEYGLLVQLYVSLLALGGVFALVIWAKYRRAMRHLSAASLSLQSGNVAPPSNRFLAKGSLEPSQEWEKPSLAGEDDFDPNRPSA